MGVYRGYGSGAYANATTVEDNLVPVTEYGATGDGTTDDTAAIQAAIDTGKPISFPKGTYKCANLTVSTEGQRFYGLGEVILKKNANGPIVTVSGAYVEFNGIKFYGDATTPTYTGNNITASGNHFRLINCGSRYAYGAAVKATGSHVQIIGTNDIYQTALADYDIEIGVSGTATLYHQLYGIYTSQSTGGIKFIDCGSQSVVGGQFGKLHISAGTSPSGVNGGMVTGARILGAITIDLSSATLIGNQIGAVVVTLGASTSGCQLIGNTYATGYSIVNNGNANNLIIRDISSGSVNQIRYGADANYNGFDVASGYVLFNNYVRMKNNQYLLFVDSAGGTTGQLAMTSGNNFSITQSHASGAMQLSVTGSTGIQMFQGGTERCRVNANGVYPGGTTALISQGAGSPEGVKTANPGSLYLNTNGGVGTTLYVKESGTGNTGWVAK